LNALTFQDVEVGEVAVALFQVKAVSDEQLVGDGEADVADREVLDEAAVGPVEQGNGRERGRSSQRERLAEVVEGEAGVDDILDDQDVPAGELDIKVFQEPDARMAPGVRARGVARELEEVEPVWNRERSREVGDEDDAGLERCDEERLEAVVIARDLGAQLADARLQLLAGEVDVPQPRRPYDASSSRYRSARRSMSRL
jgi:hypothetical protein